jgi:hypothetical protein
VPVTVANESPAGALSTAPPRFRSKAADAIDTQHARRAVIPMANLGLSSKERRCRVTRRPMREVEELLNSRSRSSRCSRRIVEIPEPTADSTTWTILLPWERTRLINTHTSRANLLYFNSLFFRPPVRPAIQLHAFSILTYSSWASCNGPIAMRKSSILCQEIRTNGMR